jgi:hypothetical protein
MKRKHIWSALPLCISLMSCADPAFDEAIAISDQYADAPVVSYTDSSGLWRISDMPSENRLKIGPSLARSIGGSFGPQVTFVPPTMRETQRTAQAWLASSGRPCSITDGRLLVSPQWEFTYSCG